MAVSDRELWRLAAGGEADAFGRLYDRHANAIYNYCFRRTADWAAAEDLTATVFLEAWRKRRRVVFDSDDAVLPWLYVVAGNVVRNETRRLRRLTRFAALGELSPERGHERADDASSLPQLPAETRASQRAKLLASMRPTRRRRVAIALVAGIAVLVAGPTLAVQRGLVDFSSGEPAPERIQLDFEFLREHSREAREISGSPEITPVGQAREVMRVTIDGESRPLWVVATAEGGFCMRMHFMSTCRIPDDDDAVFGGGGLSNSGGEGWSLLAGYVLDQRVQELVLVYQDGTRAVLPYVWVSPPIDAGFYAYGVPEAHREEGRLTAVVMGLDEEGNAVLKQCLPLSPDASEESVPEVRKLCPPRPRRDEAAGRGTTRSRPSTQPRG